MADLYPIIIGTDNIASTPGAETLLRRDASSTENSPVFTVQNPGARESIRGEAPQSVGVWGDTVSGTSGVRGTGQSGSGVFGESDSSQGAVGTSQSHDGVWGISRSRVGVFGHCATNVGVWGDTVSGTSGVRGSGRDAPGMWGSSTTDDGVKGSSDGGLGVRGVSRSNVGVLGYSTSGHGVFAQTDSPVNREAGIFVGGVLVFGDLAVVGGAKNFKIDHPLDPENRYLSHTCVESSEMKNVYDGVAELEADGTTWIELPKWFEALNGDFRYQLTAVGGPAPNLHVAEELSENRFKIAGGEEGMKVCWQVTGTRKDRSAEAHPFEVEQEKPEEERGRYLEPSLYDAPEGQRVIAVPPLAEAVEEEIDELRRLEEEQLREVEELRRRMERQEEPPPEST